MRLSTLSRLACPACLRHGRVVAFDLDPMRIDERQGTGANAELTEAYLVCRACRGAFPVLAGIAILPADVRAHLATHGNVYRRLSIPDPRLARFLLGNAGDGGDFVPFDEVVGRYGDLLPFDPARPPRPMSPRDARLDDALRAGGAVGPALEIGCGVGRGTFLLAARTGDAVGVDRSVARVRRARNVQTTDEFLLPVDETRRSETAIDLARLARRDVDFLVADPDVLPFPDRTFATVVVRDGDGAGAFPDATVVRHEALRVAAPGALVLVEGKGARDGEALPFERVVVPGGSGAVGDRIGGGARVR